MDVPTGWSFLQELAVALLLFGLGWTFGGWASRGVRTLVDRRNLDQALGRLAAGLTRWTIVAVAGVTAAGTLGIETLTLAALVGAAGLAVGLALQGSLANAASGVSILVLRPFGVGDRVTAGGSTGVCEEIGLLATTLITAANETVIVPNSAITAGTITNFSRRGTLRVGVEVGVAPGAKPEPVREALGRAARGADLVLAEPPPEVSTTRFGPQGLEWTVQVSCRSADALAAQHQVRLAIAEELAAAGIELSPGPPASPPGPSRRRS